MKKSTKRGQRIEIRPAKLNGKKNAGFRVVTIAQNGEVLSTSEVLTTPANVKKNISAQYHLFINIACCGALPEFVSVVKFYAATVIDLTGKVIKPEKK